MLQVRARWGLIVPVLGIGRCLRNGTGPILMAKKQLITTRTAVGLIRFLLIGSGPVSLLEKARGTHLRAVSCVSEQVLHAQGLESRVVERESRPAVCVLASFNVLDIVTVHLRDELLKIQNRLDYKL